MFVVQQVGQKGWEIVACCAPPSSIGTNATHLDAKLLFTRTIPTLHPLYIALAIKLFMHDDRSPATASVDDAPLGDWGSLPSPPLIISGAISSFPMSDSFDLSARRGPPPCDDEPSSTSDILFEGDRADIPNDAAPIDIVRDIVLSMGYYAVSVF